MKWKPLVLFVLLAMIACENEPLDVEEGGGTQVVALVMTPSSSDLEAGKSVQLTLDAYDSRGVKQGSSGAAWRSSDTMIARVSQSGLVTGVRAGSAVVTAELNKLSAASVVRVTGSAVAISIDIGSLTVVTGTSVRLSATVTGSSNQAVSWSSSNELVASIDQGGQLTTKSVGQTTITASAGVDPSKKATLLVTVIPTGSATAYRLVWAEDNGRRLFISDTAYAHSSQTRPSQLGVRGSPFGWNANAPGIVMNYDSGRRAFVLDLTDQAVRAALASWASTATAGGNCFRFSPVTTAGLWYPIQEIKEAIGLPQGEPGTFVHQPAGQNPLFAARVRSNADGSLALQPIAGATCQ